MDAGQGNKPIATGRFSKTPFAHILIYLLDRKMTGTLEIRDENHQVSLYFRDGSPAKIKSTVKGRELGRVLCDLGVITAEQLESCSAEVANGGLQGEVLIRHQLIDGKALTRGLQEQMLLKLVDLFGMPQASYAFYESVNLLGKYGSEEIFPIDPFPVLIAGLREKGGSLDLAPVLNTLKGKWLSLNDLETLRRFRLNHDERELCIELLQKPIPYEELMKSVAQLQYALYVLLITRQLKLSETAPLTSVDPPDPVSHQLFDSAPPPKSTVSQHPKTQALKEEIKARAVKIASQNYYEMLGLQFDAPANEARKAFFKLAKKFHPDRVAGTPAADMKDTLQYIFSNLSQAHSTLIDPDARQEYNDTLAGGVSGGSPEAESEQDAEVRDTLEAESLHQRALVHIRRSQFKEAEALVERIRVLRPDQSEYLATWAYLQGQLRPAKAPVKDLVDALRQSYKDNSKSERIMLYLAQMLERNGSIKEARTFYERVLERNPGSIEAGRAIRLIEMRDRKEESKAKGFFKRILK